MKQINYFVAKLAEDVLGLNFGKPEKKEVEQMVKLTLQTEQLPKLDDTVDAIAIAICHSRAIR